MAAEKITTAELFELMNIHPVLDVRSPGEFKHAHIPGAYSLPLFTDDERKVVGTAYKQESRQIAIKHGLDFFGVKMKLMVEEVEALVKKQAAGSLKNTVIVHCWRGGMRSAAVAWLLDLYGFKVYLLTGGYKTYRQWANEQFEKQYSFQVLGGYTGSGKTLVLHELKQRQQPVIDLEKLANHKGSAFGALGESAQPSQEMFENLLAKELHSISGNSLNDARIYLEDESQRIGLLNIPNALWQQMRKSPIQFFDVPFEDRLDYLTLAYGKFDKEKLVNAVIRIQKRLGGLETKNAIGFLLENNQRECFRILLKYYDKWYSKGLYNRDNLSTLLNTIPCTTMDIRSMTNILINENAPV
ncbi:MAG: tRNA 2-selenouridine(34) synthase MnmH [Bacteroidota bacterium]